MEAQLPPSPLTGAHPGRSRGARRRLTPTSHSLLGRTCTSVILPWNNRNIKCELEGQGLSLGNRGCHFWAGEMCIWTLIELIGDIIREDSFQSSLVSVRLNDNSLTEATLLLLFFIALRYQTLKDHRTPWKKSSRGVTVCLGHERWWEISLKIKEQVARRCWLN